MKFETVLPRSRCCDSMNIINTTYPSMDLPQGPSDSPDIVLGSSVVLTRLKEINNRGGTKSDCLIALCSVTDNILNKVKDPWDIVRGGDPAAVPPGRELVITAAKDECRANTKMSTSKMNNENGRHFTYSDEEDNVEQDGVKVHAGVESYRRAENNSRLRQRHESLKQLQRRRIDIQQRLHEVDNDHCIHSQSKNKLSEMYCRKDHQSLSYSAVGVAMKEKKCDKCLHLCCCQEEKVRHDHSSHEEPESAKMKGGEFSRLTASDIPKQVLSYQPTSDFCCNNPRGIESHETPLMSSHVGPELKMTTTNGNGKPCAKENQEEEGISVDLSNCHIEKNETVLKEGQRRRDMAV